MPGNSIDLNGMVMGEVREAFPVLRTVWRSGIKKGYKEVPDEPLTIFWYGPGRLEMPIDLTVSR